MRQTYAQRRWRREPLEPNYGWQIKRNRTPKRTHKSHPNCTQIVPQIAPIIAPNKSHQEQKSIIYEREIVQTRELALPCWRLGETRETSHLLSWSPTSDPTYLHITYPTSKPTSKTTSQKSFLENLRSNIRLRGSVRLSRYLPRTNSYCFVWKFMKGFIFKLILLETNN